MKKLKKCLALLLMLVILINLVALDVSALQNAERKVLNVGLQYEPYTLDPSFIYNTKTAANEENNAIMNSVLEGLYRKIGNDIVPGIAESFEVSKDGLVYTFRLRDAEWSDGVPVTAYDFEYSWKRSLVFYDYIKDNYLLDYLLNAQRYVSGKCDIDDVGVHAKDEKTLIVHLQQPAVFFPTLTSTSVYLPARQDLVEENDYSYMTDPGYFISNGPFVLSAWTFGDKITLEKNESYWNNSSIKLDEVNLIFREDFEVRLNKYSKGEIDLLIRSQYDEDNVIPENEATRYADGTLWYLNFNLSDKIMNNLNIRKALSYSINRDELKRDTYIIHTEPARSIIAPDVIPGNLKTFREEAKDLFKDGTSSAVKAFLKNGLKELKLKKLPTIKLLMPSTGDGPYVGYKLEEMWERELGIDIEVEYVASSELYPRQYSNDYQIAYAGWGDDFADPINYLEMFVTGNSDNNRGYSNKTYDGYINQSNLETNRVKRMELLRKAEKYLITNMVIAPLYHAYHQYALKPYVTGVNVCPSNTAFDFIYADVDNVQKENTEIKIKQGQIRNK